MAIPTAAELALAYLRLIADGKSHDIKTWHDDLRKVFMMSPEEAAQRLPSGRETVFQNRLRNAKFSMRQQGLILIDDSSHRVRITERGYERLQRVTAKGIQGDDRTR